MEKNQESAPSDALEASMWEKFCELTDAYHGEVEAYLQSLKDAGIDLNDIVLVEYPMEISPPDEQGMLRVKGKFHARFKTDEERNGDWTKK